MQLHSIFWLLVTVEILVKAEPLSIVIFHLFLFFLYFLGGFSKLYLPTLLLIFNSFFVCFLYISFFLQQPVLITWRQCHLFSLKPYSFVWFWFGLVLRRCFLLYIIFILPKFLFVYLHVRVSFMFKTSQQFFGGPLSFAPHEMQAIKQCLGTLYSLLRMGFTVQLSGQLEDACYQYIGLFFFYFSTGNIHKEEPSNILPPCF